MNLALEGVHAARVPVVRLPEAHSCAFSAMCTVSDSKGLARQKRVTVTAETQRDLKM